MKHFKKLYLALIFLLFYLPDYYPQQQVHIPWPSLADSPWPIGRGDAQATGRSKYIGPRTPNVIWRKDMPLGIENGPVIGYNDDLFMGTYSYNFNSPEPENYFYSVDKDGGDIWTFITQARYANFAGATIANDGSIYFESNGDGLYALNPDGTVKWKNERFNGGIFRRYIAVALNNNLYIPGPDSLFIIDPQNGDIIQAIHVPYIAPTEIVFSTGGDTIFFKTGRFQSNDPKALNAFTLTGEHLWSVQFSGDNYGTPLVDNENRIYVFGREGNNRFLYCVNPNGTINWQFPFNNISYQDFSSPTIDSNGNIIFSATTLTWPSDSGVVVSIDYDGKLNWVTSLGSWVQDGALIDMGFVSDAKGKIYCGTAFNQGGPTNFWCIDNNGEILWKFNLEGYRYTSSPAIGPDGTLYIGTHLSSAAQNNQRNLIAINDKGMSVDDEGQEMTFRLYQNYPNPFNPVTHIDFKLLERTNVTLKVFNALGQEVKTLVNEEMIPGYYSRIFDGKDLPSGVYFYELVTGKTRITKKMLLLR